MLERSKKRSGDLWSLQQHTSGCLFFLFLFFSTFAISDFVFVLFCVFGFLRPTAGHEHVEKPDAPTQQRQPTIQREALWLIFFFCQRNKRHRQTHAKKRRAFGNNLRGGWASLPGGSTRTGDGKSSDDDTREREKLERAKKEENQQRWIIKWKH